MLAGMLYSIAWMTGAAAFGLSIIYPYLTMRAYARDLTAS